MSAIRTHCAALVAFALAGCATGTSSFAPRPLATPHDLRDVQSRTVGDVTVSVSMLTDEQARRQFGVDLGARHVQALWMSIANGSDRRLWFIRTILDQDFYSEEEAALLVEDDVPKSQRAALHQYFRDESIRAQIAPRTVTDGFVFLPKVEGGRYVDIRLQGDAYLEDSAGGTAAVARPPRELRFDFAVALPDGDFDYERLDPGKVYGGQTLPDLTRDQLRSTLEQLPCCAADQSGEHDGDPLNIVLVGDPDDVLNSLSRSGWSFTHRITARSVTREIGAALTDSPYPVAPVSNLYVFGRSQDVALQRARRSIAQRNHMRLWLAPYTYQQRSVWLGQVSRDIGVKITTKSPTLTTHVIDPQIDTTREYLFHSLIAQGFVSEFGFVKGSAYATPAEPRYNLTDDPYFSDGLRLVVVLAPDPVPPDEIRSMLWEQSSAPVAEGQSEAARRHVRPMNPPSPADAPR
ncbi:MAG TPA: LssY C-terminal domain-containing protein [Steroidobacteraceae bacterium]|nr:LssY C-terminal domain-containing protein [Steroidobacteraceae bacterium]